VNFAAESDGITSDHVIDRLLEETPTHEDQLLRDDRFQKMFAS
jgi:MoxR-like ATPase